ncbi:hypothetical protein DPMN_103189 [Dreissena polymorpha]|uniref:Uncharacterized protein n=1 Tax=Dreissena polymorpha TaxID=45954 RepID=A0A9D4JZY9_DREPO|nr:hypothetical protein DPMN_103189 [Dreissena polymorpha]
MKFMISTIDNERMKGQEHTGSQHGKVEDYGEQQDQCIHQHELREARKSWDQPCPRMVTLPLRSK